MRNPQEKTIHLRAEQPADYQKTENVLREAFWNQYMPGCDEHYLMHIMRDCPSFIPELDIVAVCDGKIIGNVVCMKAAIQDDEGVSHEVLCLGPIAVLPEYQGTGVGGKLIAHVAKLAKEMGHRAIFLYGDPDYYSRQGFIPAKQFGIRTEDNMYAAAHQVLPLYEGALSGIKGRYLEDAVFQVDPAAAKAYDEKFPAKERLSGTPVQQRFQHLVSLREKA